MQIIFSSKFFELAKCENVRGLQTKLKETCKQK